MSLSTSSPENTEISTSVHLLVEISSFVVEIFSLICLHENNQFEKQTR